MAKSNLYSAFFHLTIYQEHKPMSVNIFMPHEFYLSAVVVFQIEKPYFGWIPLAWAFKLFSMCRSHETSLSEYPHTCPFAPLCADPQLLISRTPSFLDHGPAQVVVDNPVPKEAIFDLILIWGLSFYHAEWLRDIRRRAPWWVAVNVPTFPVWESGPGIHGGGRECMEGGH